MSGGSKAGPSSQTVKNGTQTENLTRTQQTTLPDWYLEPMAIDPGPGQ